MNRKISVGVALSIALIAMAVTFAITWLLSMSTFNSTVSAVTQLQAEYGKIAELDRYVRGNYYGDIDDATLFDRMAAGYMSGLGDRYSVYYTESEYTELLAIERGELVGVGLEIIRDGDGSYRIVRVYPDSPAARAGVQPQGRIVSVNGEEARGFASAERLKSAMRGADGTDLALVCLYNVADEASYTIRRQAGYKPPTVETIVVGDYAYIRIAEFASNTYSDFDYSLRQAQNAGVSGIVFDVRGNAGGLFRDCYSIIDLLTPRGTVAKSVGKTGAARVLATSDENFVNLPMVVLVNAGTSGPAELFAASLRDLNGSPIVGSATAGKGTIQKAPQRLSDGSAVSVTEAVLYTGKDETFNLTGLLPDIEITSEQMGEEMILNPSPTTDPETLRAFEAVRTLVREAGGDPGEAVTGQAPAQSGSAAASGAGSSVSQVEDE